MIVFILLAWLACGIGASMIATGKGQSGCLWFGLGVLLGPLGLMGSALTSRDTARVNADGLAQGILRSCPCCAEPIRTEAIRCRYCGADVPKLLVAEEERPWLVPALAVLGILVALWIVTPSNDPLAPAQLETPNAADIWKDWHTDEAWAKKHYGSGGVELSGQVDAVISDNEIRLKSADPGRGVRAIFAKDEPGRVGKGRIVILNCGPIIGDIRGLPFASGCRLNQNAHQ